MSDREPLTPDLKAVEAALASLAPAAPSAADRDRWMFAAGRASASVSHRGRVTYAAAFVLLGLSAFASGAPYARYFGPPQSVEIASPTPFGPNPSSNSTATAADSPASYLQLRRSIGALESSVAVSEPPMPMHAVPASRREIFRELLN